MRPRSPWEWHGMDYSGNAVVQSNISVYNPSRIAIISAHRSPSDYACTAEIEGFKVGNVCRNTPLTTTNQIQVRLIS